MLQDYANSNWADDINISKNIMGFLYIIWYCY